MVKGKDIEKEIRREELKELYKISEKSLGVAVVLGIFLSPIAYLYTRKWIWALVNFLTLNYFFTGFIIVPIHCYSIITNARRIAKFSKK